MHAISCETRLLLCALEGKPVPDLASERIQPSAASERASEHRCPGTDALCVEDAIELVVSSIESGSFTDGVVSNVVKNFLWNPETGVCMSSSENPEDFYRAVGIHINRFLDNEPEDTRMSRCLLVLAAGVAVLLAFWQSNVTGPRAAFPCCRALILPGDSQSEDEESWNGWAKKELMIDGCDLVGSCFLPQYLVLAKIMIVESLHGSRMSSPYGNRSLPCTTSWWACRTHYAHQRILVERSSTLNAAFAAPETEVFNLNWENLDEKHVSVLKPAMHLEYGLIMYEYGHIDHARRLFSQAMEACGLQLHLTGMLGYRTIHQVEPKAQMVLLASTDSKSREPFLPESGIEVNKDLSGKPRSFSEDEILMVPKLVSEDTINEQDDKCLSSLQQAVILAHCLGVKKSNPDDEMRGWQMAPFIEAVDAQLSSKFMIKCCCRLLRIRWECTRSRTKLRALVMLEELITDMSGVSDCEMRERMCYAFCVQFPTIAVLRKEYADMLISCGMVRDALQIFEELELWNSLIDCYCLLDKKSIALDLIKKRLEDEPADPRLWCALGDVTLEERHYAKAWEVSGYRFGRAQRSLARLAYNKGEYLQSIEHWQSALALNPMHPDGWFALGSAALKARDLNKAVDAFTHAVQLDPENGEAWNNIAAIHMSKKKSRLAFVAFREALKFKRSSWQMWENYAHVSLDVCNFAQAIEALNMTLDLSQGKRVSINCLEKLVEETERSGEGVECDNNDAIPEEECWQHADDDGPSVKSSSKGFVDNVAESMVSREFLLAQVGKLLCKVVQTSQDSTIWGLLARWHRVKGDTMMCQEALLKQVRSLQGLSWQNSIGQFQKLCQASLQLCQAYMQSAQENGNRKELFSAQMLLRNILKQGETFSETDDYAAIKTCLSEVQEQVAKC